MHLTRAAIFTVAVDQGMQLGSVIHRTAGTVNGKARQQMGL